MNIPPPLPLTRTHNIQYDGFNVNMNPYMNTNMSQPSSLYQIETLLTKDEHRKRSGGFIDIDHKRNISIPLKLNRQVTV